MKLRSGFTYNCNVIYVKKKVSKVKCLGNYLGRKDLSFLRCSICMIPYKEGDLISSCNIKNIRKHNFHSACFKEHIKISSIYSSNIHCPYCMIILNKSEIAVRKL